MRPRHMVIALAVLVTGLWLASGCSDSDSGTAAPTAVEATGTWAVEEPGAHGFSAQGLEEAAAWVGEQDSDALIVVHGGAIIFERYWNDHGPEAPWGVFSVTKSYTATLVGIAEQQGLLDIEEPASRYIPEWVGTGSENLPIRQLMTGDSGRTYDVAGDFPGLAGPAPDDITEYALGRGQEFEPGTTWQYNQMAIQCLDRVLETATGRPTAQFAQEALFDPLGMSQTLPGLDGAGNMTLAWGLQASARDLARFGLLYRNRGRWNGQEILREDFVTAATTTANPVNDNYGYLFWLNADGNWYEAVTLAYHPEGKVYPDAPDDVFVASGNLGQMVFVSPSEDLVIIRQGHEAPRGSGASALFYNEIYRRVVAARQG